MRITARPVSARASAGHTSGSRGVLNSRGAASATHTGIRNSMNMAMATLVLRTA